MYRGTIRRSWQSVVIPTAGALVLGLLAVSPILRAQASPAPAMSSYGDKGLPSMTSAMGQKGGETVLATRHILRGGWTGGGVDDMTVWYTAARNMSWPSRQSSPRHCSPRCWKRPCRGLLVRPR